MPAWTPRGANFLTAPAVPVFASISLPASFTPRLGSSPIWLQQGAEVALEGSADGRTTVVGFSGSRFDQSRVIAQDGGPLAQSGTMLDLAASIDGQRMAAIVRESASQAVIVVRRLTTDSPDTPIAYVEGDYNAATLSWLGGQALAVSLQRHPADSKPEGMELHVIGIDGKEARPPAKLACDFTPLLWSPDGQHAFAGAASGAMLVSLEKKEVTCQPLQTAPQVRFLGWRPDSAAFLYFSQLAGINAGGGVGTFEYELQSGASRMIAIASSAAAYTKDGSVAVLGNRNLTWRGLATRPTTPVITELALIDTRNSQMTVTTLGLTTRASMLAASSMLYSATAQTVAMEMPLPGAPVNPLLLFYFQIPAKAAGVLASGTAGDLATMAWSPDGNLLAVLDAAAEGPTLAILGPPPLSAQSK